jgi:hypothetical protein
MIFIYQKIIGFCSGYSSSKDGVCIERAVSQVLNEVRDGMKSCASHADEFDCNLFLLND